MRFKTKEAKGITLIALVITIIVLLILAGVTIATLTGDNGILSKANDSKTETRGASVEEARDLWKINQEADNQTESTTAQTLEELIDDLVKQKLLTEDEKDQILGNDEKGIKATGQVTIGSRTIVFKTIEILAGDVLKINSDAEEEASKSPYVLYNNILCRVLYNDDTHGIQIISADNVGNVTLGNGDTLVGNADFEYDGSVTINDNFKLAATSYNKAVTTLNNKAKTYKNSTALDARCLGSDPVPTNGVFAEDVAGYWSGRDEYLTTYGWNGKFKTSDTKYQEDVAKLNSLGLNISTDTWLASRIIYVISSDNFGVYRVVSNGDTYGIDLFNLSSDGSVGSNSHSYAFRPVFLLPSGVIISGGDGSSGNPYVIE